MIFDKSNKYYPELPGLSVLIGGMMVNNLAYWGCNQYIVQRALGADLKTARKGILFAAFLKLLIPIIAVLPGIAMYVLHQKGMFQKEIFLKQPKEIKFSVFVNNQFLQKGRYITLIKKIDDEVVDQKEFQLSGDKLFEGWFKLG